MRTCTGGHLAAIALAALLTALPGCGGGSSGSSGQDPAPGGDPQAAEGARLFQERGCAVCHSTNGSRRAGPTMRGLAGSTVRLADGSEAVADDEYLVRAIVDPDAQITRGYPGQTMKAVAATVTAGEARAIVAYLETLR